MVAPSKNAALAILFAEAGTSSEVVAQWPPFGFTALELVSVPEASTNLTWLTEQMHQTSKGFKTCKRAGIARCRAPYIVGDEWDSTLVWLGRALRYDSLVLTASLCCSARPESQCGVSEIADLRIPQAVLTSAKMNSTLYAKGSPEARFGTKQLSLGSLPASFDTTKSDVLGHKWMLGLRRARRFTIRNPFNLTATSSSRPCRFTTQPHMWLGCEGHYSMSLTDLPSATQS